MVPDGARPARSFAAMRCEALGLKSFSKPFKNATFEVEEAFLTSKWSVSAVLDLRKSSKIEVLGRILDGLVFGSIFHEKNCRFLYVF